MDSKSTPEHKAALDGRYEFNWSLTSDSKPRGTWEKLERIISNFKHWHPDYECKCNSDIFWPDSQWREWERETEGEKLIFNLQTHHLKWKTTPQVSNENFANIILSVTARATNKTSCSVTANNKIHPVVKIPCKKSSDISSMHCSKTASPAVNKIITAHITQTVTHLRKEKKGDINLIF